MMEGGGVGGRRMEERGESWVGKIGEGRALDKEEGGELGGGEIEEQGGGEEGGGSCIGKIGKGGELGGG